MKKKWFWIISSGVLIFLFLDFNLPLLYKVYKKKYSFNNSFVSYRRQMIDVNLFVADPIFEFHKDKALFQKHWNDLPLVPIFGYYVLGFLSFFIEFVWNHSNFVYGTLHVISCVSYIFILIYTILIAKRLFGKGTAVISLFLFSISYELMMNSGYFKPSIFITFPVIATFYHTLCAADNPNKGRHYILIGVFAGMSVITKLNGLISLGIMMFAFVYPLITKKCSLGTIVKMLIFTVVVCILMIMIFSPYQFFKYPSWYFQFPKEYSKCWGYKTDFPIIDLFMLHNIFCHFYDVEYYGGLWVLLLGVGGLVCCLCKSLHSIFKKKVFGINDGHVSYMIFLYLASVFAIASAPIYKGLVVSPVVGGRPEYHWPHLGGAFHYQYYWIFLDPIFIIFASFALWTLLVRIRQLRFHNMIYGVILLLYIGSLYNILWSKVSLARAILPQEINEYIDYQPKEFKSNIINIDAPDFTFQYFMCPEIYMKDYRLRFMVYPPLLNYQKFAQKKVEWYEQNVRRRKGLKEQILMELPDNIILYFDYTDDEDFMKVYKIVRKWTYTGKSMLHAHACGTTAYYYRKKSKGDLFEDIL